MGLIEVWKVFSESEIHDDSTYQECDSKTSKHYYDSVFSGQSKKIVIITCTAPHQEIDLNSRVDTHTNYGQYVYDLLPLSHLLAF